MSAPKKKNAVTAAKNASRASAEFECWDFANWPANVYPHDPARAKQLYRSNKNALIAEGAISREGRNIIFFPKPYLRWLRKLSERVKEYALPCNAPEVLAKRANGHDKTGASA